MLVHLHTLPEGLDLDLGTPPGGEQDRGRLVLRVQVVVLLGQEVGRGGQVRVPAGESACKRCDLPWCLRVLLFRLVKKLSRFQSPLYP